jgi:hypothetical protein
MNKTLKNNYNNYNPHNIQSKTLNKHKIVNSILLISSTNHEYCETLYSFKTPYHQAINPNFDKPLHGIMTTSYMNINQ